jgi:hypothetical protein
MKSFTQYLSEIFSVSSSKKANTDYHPDLEQANDENVIYHHSSNGKRIRTHLSSISAGHDFTGNQMRKIPDDVDRNNVWEVDFTVNGKWDKGESAGEFPSDVTKKVFDHLNHFVNRAKDYYGAPHLVYTTANEKKHRIYQGAARRLGVQATNLY